MNKISLPGLTQLDLYVESTALLPRAVQPDEVGVLRQLLVFVHFRQFGVAIACKVD